MHGHCPARLPPAPVPAHPAPPTILRDKTTPSGLSATANIGTATL